MGPDRAHVGEGRDGMEQAAWRGALRAAGAAVGGGRQPPEHPRHQGTVGAG